MEITTVRVSKKTLERLKSLGRKGETYNELINKLIDGYENSEDSSV